MAYLSPCRICGITVCNRDVCDDCLGVKEELGAKATNAQIKEIVQKRRLDAMAVEFEQSLKDIAEWQKASEEHLRNDLTRY